MNEEIINEYLIRVPVEIRESIMELNNNNKWAVYIALTLEGKKYFNEIKNQFGANPNTIDTILKSLIAGGLVTRKVERLSDIGFKERSYYQTTKLGLKLMDALYEAILPPASMQFSVTLKQECEDDGWIKSDTLDAPLYDDSYLQSNEIITLLDQTRLPNLMQPVEV